MELLKVLFGILAVMILIKVLIKDIKKAGKYTHAMTAIAQVISVDGCEEMSVYGRSQHRTYYKYSVEFTIPQGTYSDTLLSRNKKLQVGDPVEVRYAIDDNGVYLLNDLAVRRLKEILVTSVIVIPLCIIILYIKTK